MNKHNQKPTDVFNKQDVTLYLTYIKILEDLNIQRFKYLLIFLCMLNKQLHLVS